MANENSLNSTELSNPSEDSKHPWEEPEEMVEEEEEEEDGELFRLDSINGAIVSSPMDKTWDYQKEIPIRLEGGGWTRDEDLEKEFGRKEHVYRKDFESSEVNDTVTTVIVRVSEDEESYTSDGLGISDVEVLSFDGKRPFDRTDLDDMIRAIDFAEYNLIFEAQVPFVAGYTFRGNKKIWRWNTAKEQREWNQTTRDSFKLLDAEREISDKLTDRLLKDLENS